MSTNRLVPADLRGIAAPAMNLNFLDAGDGVFVIVEEQAPVRTRMRYLRIYADRVEACRDLMDRGMLSENDAKVFVNPQPPGSLLWAPLYVRDPKTLLRDFAMTTIGYWN